MKLKALRSFTYATRRLLPGDIFDMPERTRIQRQQALAIIAQKRAKKIRETVEIPPPPPAIAEQISATVTATDDVKAARDEYEQALGKRPFPGWGVGILREKIAAAKNA